MIEINQENFEKEVTQSVLPVMVEFGADWCGPCKRLEPELEKLESKWSDQIVMAHVNVDENPDLAAQFMVMGVPTVVLIKDGDVKERITGFKPLPKLIEIFGKHLS